MKALIAMSGGVDSSVAAFIMKKKGYDCTGCTMRLYENDMIGKDLLDTCCSLENTQDARSVCDRIGIPYKIFHFENLFTEEVIEPFAAAYERGHTPNPCIECNRCLKFDHLYSKMDEAGCDVLVTGHYAMITYDEEKKRYLLHKARDAKKDQSYVLYMLTQEMLSRICFPLGEYTKDEIRKIAAENGFVNAQKHDSQDICFVPDGKYGEFLERYRKTTYPEGDFKDKEGRVLGRHKGYVRYTIGQRKGLGISAECPLYVTDIDPVSNTVTLGKNEDLFSNELIAGNINLISVDRIDEPMRVKAKIRYRQTEQPATVIMTDEDHIKVTFDEPQRAITKGQAAVFYDGDTVVGGGTIIG
ncbi:MAG: tRNA 2-thiouridine(34) synthase MnmA [Lachnospiraceae bacterium]|nr:tRNA 2-thiouridine(34) synthase MnmA [Lachnospiraceae bacterium]